MTFERFMIFLIAVMIVIAIFGMFSLQERNTKCRDLGGLLVDTPSGKTCIKAERIQL